MTKPLEAKMKQVITAANHAKTVPDWGNDAGNFHDVMTPDLALELIAALEQSEANATRLRAERDALREQELHKATNTRAAADIYFQLIEECEIPPGGSLVQHVDDLKERIAELENDEVRQRLANAEHQLHMAELAKYNLRASRKAQFKKRKAAEKRIAEIESLGRIEYTRRLERRVAELEASHAQVIQARDHYKSLVSASQLAVKPPAEFLTIGESLRTQDNRITSDPMFCIYQKEEIVVDAEYNHDRIVWWHSDGYEASANQARRLELLSDGLRDTGEWKRLAVKEINDFVTCCFTERGCKDYLAINGHNLRKPFICVKSGFRNNEYQAVRNWLMSVAGTVQGDES